MLEISTRNLLNLSQHGENRGLDQCLHAQLYCSMNARNNRGTCRKDEKEREMVFPRCFSRKKVYPWEVPLILFKKRATGGSLLDRFNVGARIEARVPGPDSSGGYASTRPITVSCSAAVGK